MRDRISDPEVRMLAALSIAIAEDYIADEQDPWEDSPFGWILKAPSRTKGAIAESLVAGWCAAKGFDVIRSDNSQADRIIQGHRVEIKLSTLWKNGGYRFQQIRDQEYDYLFCLGLSPFDAHAWLIPKRVLYEHVIGHMGQHTGSGGSETAWIGFKVDSPFLWMSPYGDRLSTVDGLLAELGRGSY